MKKIEKLERIARQLEPGASQRKEIFQKAGDHVEQYVELLPQMYGYKKGELNKLKSMEIGEDGKPIEQILDILKCDVDDIGVNTASGTLLGFIPGGGLWASSIADMLAAVSNRYSGVVFSGPGAVEIENQMIHWLSSLVGYPPEAHGNLTSGGSIASLIAIKAARDFHQINSGNVKQSVIYFSEQVHHCVHKAFHITGLYEAVLRTIPLNKLYQMDVTALADQIEQDVYEGLNPFLVIASAGTTDTGAIDPLDKIASICSQHNLWFHVDAAYGGFFLLVDAMKEKFKGIERSNSVVMDPHKTLFLPYGSGAVLVRDRKTLLESNAHKAAYMEDTYGLEELSPSDTSPELSRHFRGLRMWLPLHLHGLKPFKANLEEKLLLCQYFHKEVASMGFETGPAPQLSVTIFRYPGKDSLNHKLIDALHDDGRVFFSSTTINGQLWIRCAVVSFRTHLKEINLALIMIRENLDKVLNVSAD